MFLSSLRVQTSQDFIQILGLLDDLIGKGINITYSTVLGTPPEHLLAYWGRELGAAGVVHPLVASQARNTNTPTQPHTALRESAHELTVLEPNISGQEQDF